MINIRELSEVAKYLKIEVINRDAGFSPKLLNSKISRYRRETNHTHHGDGDGRIGYYQAKKLEPIFNKIISALDSSNEDKK